MRTVLRFVAAAICCVLVAVGVVIWMIGPQEWQKAFGTRAEPTEVGEPNADAQDSAAEDDNEIIAEFADPNAPGTSNKVFISRYEFDSGIFQTAADFTAPVRTTIDRSRSGGRRSWSEAHRGLAYWRNRADALVLDSPPTAEQATLAIRTWRALAFLEMYEGRFAEAKTWLERALAS